MFVGIPVIEFAYRDDWGRYDTVFEDATRRLSLIAIADELGEHNRAHNNAALRVFFSEVGNWYPGRLYTVSPASENSQLR